MSPLTSYIVETMVTLLAIVALAALVLVAARKAGVGRPSGPLTLVGRLPLDGRRAVYLIRAGKKVLVVGASEAGLNRLGELDELPEELAAPSSKSFSDVLGQVLRKPRSADGDAADHPVPAKPVKANDETP